MSIEASAEFYVGKYLCEIRYAGGALHCEWSPHYPARMSRKERQAYRRGRDAFIRRIAETIGARALLVVEV